MTRGRVWGEDIRPVAAGRALQLSPARGLNRPRTRSIPESTSSSFARDILAVRSFNNFLSKATTCETFATDFFASPVARHESSTFPGAPAHFSLLVRRTQTTVPIRLRFSASPRTTTRAFAFPVPNRWVREGRPTRRHPGRLPFATFQDTPHRPRHERIDALSHFVST